MHAYGELSERQHSGAWPIRPVKGDNSALVQLCLAVSQRPQKRPTAHVRHERFAAKEHDARRSLTRVRKDLRKIQVVR
jgi:hypothetical protein